MTMLHSEPLADLKWEKRLLVINLHPEGPTAEKVIAQLTAKEEQLRERDLVVIDLSVQAHHFPEEVNLSEKQKATLRKRFRITPAEGSLFILIGKDGGEKARQKGGLALGKLFERIDAMPMRRAEMKRQKADS